MCVCVKVMGAAVKSGGSSSDSSWQQTNERLLIGCYFLNKQAKPKQNVKHLDQAEQDGLWRRLRDAWLSLKQPSSNSSVAQQYFNSSMLQL